MRRLLTALWRAASRLRRRRAPEGECHSLAGLRELDAQVLQQLGRAVGLSERAAMELIDRLAALRQLSSRLVRYLQQAQEQSESMQSSIELNSRIIHELAAFVQTLPVQIGREREHMQQLVTDVKSLSAMTDTIRGIARQTEILAINAAVEAARAGEAGKGFAVLAGEVRRLATQSNASAAKINDDISALVEKVEVAYGGDFEARTRHNESEAQRLGNLTRKLDESYVDMRQFYEMLMTGVTHHNTELDRGLGALLDTAQYQDVIKQIIDRVEPAVHSRNDVLAELIQRLRSGQRDTPDLDARVDRLVEDYLRSEAEHRDPEAAEGAAPGKPGVRIELF